MSLPDPSPRQPLHTRRISYEGYLRDDGLWDIDARLVDSKSYPIHMHERGDLAPGDPVHDLQVRVTVDDAFVIQAVSTSMNSAPFPECQGAADPMQRLLGLTLGAGWRKAIEGAIGGVAGCTHLRELLFGVATAAFQTIPGYRSQQARDRGELPDPNAPAPFFVGKCLSWDREGPVVQRLLPMFWRPPAGKTRS